MHGECLHTGGAWGMLGMHEAYVPQKLPWRARSAGRRHAAEPTTRRPVRDVWPHQEVRWDMGGGWRVARVPGGDHDGRRAVAAAVAEEAPRTRRPWCSESDGARAGGCRVAGHHPTTGRWRGADNQGGVCTTLTLPHAAEGSGRAGGGGGASDEAASVLGERRCPGGRLPCGNSARCRGAQERARTPVEWQPVAGECLLHLGGLPQVGGRALRRL